MPIWSVVPFVGLLLSIAILPLARPHWWHENRNKAAVAILFGLPVAVFVSFRDLGALGHAALEYLAFVSLLGSLYVISGGVRLRGSLPGTPISNTALLALGTLLSNLVGTTGAAMLLIRPYLHANRARASKTHLIVFFIFIVANCGGCLTPLGDPPLFLGFLKGVPFIWTLGLWKPWLAVCAALLVVFFIFDRVRFRKEVPMDSIAPGEPLGLEGSHNLLLLAGVIATVLAGGFWVQPTYGETPAQLFQCAALATFAGLSLWFTPKELRRANEFSWHPFVEVVVLFLGIFAAMIPALALLKTRGHALGLSNPWEYFWATGTLSAFLDNAPTYLALFSMAQYLPDEVGGTTDGVLSAISCGAVFFGAATYIGNGPNFMVKAIAEHAGVTMPSFFGYLAWSAAVLLPLFLLVTLVFFR
jgi:Na+/H+ antiporter NhaD/arsenite permease-like protein